MTTQEFIASLDRQVAEAPAGPLVFAVGEARVPAGYHVTEIKATTVDSMDCGGRSNRWRETSLQLWAPEPTEGAAFMSIAKFLGIYRRVAAGVPLDDGAELRVEYGPIGSPAVSYLVAGVDTAGDTVVVRLAPPAVACKAADRTLGDIPVLNATADATCCAPDASDSGACCG